LCIIKNANNTQEKKVINSPISTMCSQFVADVGKEFSLPADAFELMYELPISSSDEQHQVSFHWHIFANFLYDWTVSCYGCSNY